MLILVVVLALLSALVLLISSFMSAEICPYVNLPRGYNQSDYVLNSILINQWPQIEAEGFELPPPQNVLFGLEDVCTPNKTQMPTLLPSIGITRIANLTQITETADFQQEFSSISS